jgi:hypothetical protein
MGGGKEKGGSGREKRVREREVKRMRGREDKRMRG